jgi:hypothetical protein
LQVVSSSAKYLVLAISIPAIVSPGTYTGSLTAARPSPLYYADLIPFNITVGPARPEIIMASPSQAQSRGGDVVTLFVLGFPQPMARAAVSTTVSAVAVLLLADPSPDGHGGAALSFTAPRGSGMAMITVIYTFFAAGHGQNLTSTLRASIPFLYVSDGIQFSCSSG